MVSEAVLVAAAQADSRAGVAALTFLTWDMLINFADEVYFVWRGPKTWLKWMYLFIRHFPILVEMSLLTIITTDARFSYSGCRDWIIYEAVAVEAITLAVEVVLIIRVYALYNRNKLMLYFLSFLMLSEVTVMITALCLSIPRMTFNESCLITGAPYIFMSYWIASLIFETILFGLTLKVFFATIHHGLGERTILYVFFRDGTWAFALIFVIMLLNTLMYQLNHTPLAGICYFWDLSVMSFAGSHILLNLRRLGSGTAHLDNSFFTTSVGMDFSTNQDVSNYDSELSDLSGRSIPKTDNTLDPLSVPSENSHHPSGRV